jgi:hypothetical protein
LGIKLYKQQKPRLEEPRPALPHNRQHRSRMKSTILARFKAGCTFPLENARLDCLTQSLCYDMPDFLITAILLTLTRNSKRCRIPYPSFSVQTLAKQLCAEKD